jgi:uncharacterized flavoprotein (TIGR03862 family)
LKAGQHADVAVIGAGPAGLAAAEVLAQAGHRVTLIERMPSPARKFLMAGRGGLNLTHSEPLDLFLSRYGAARPRLEAAIAAFPPQAMRDWAAGLGQETFVGSSGRVFPEAFKASPLLRAWLARLTTLGVTLRTRTQLTGIAPDGTLSLAVEDGTREKLSPDATVLALGGASWPRLGADGSFAGFLSRRGVAMRPWEPSNTGWLVGWSPVMVERFAGTPLKRIAIAIGDRVATGEAVVTRAGLEGGAVYALSAPMREALAQGPVTIRIDLRPDLSPVEVRRRLEQPRGKQSFSTAIHKQAGLPPVAIALLREADRDVPKRSAAQLAALVKACPVTVTGLSGLERAISSAGGVDLAGVDEAFMLIAVPGVFAAGEMLDWDAPTGGYLLQASVATGRAAGEGAARWLAARGDDVA